MLRLAIPVLHVSSSGAAEEFYCKKLGFQVEFVYRIEKNNPDPGYIGLKRDGAWLHISSFPGDGVSGGVVYLLVDNVDVLYEEFIQKKVPIDLKPTNQIWKNREMYVKDLDGNSIRFIQESTEE
jgi:catechol 2,3-dioxygenase-like lactoylglutathione lyase family enzyme